MISHENISVIKVGINELDLVSGLFDKYRVFYKQPSNVLEGKKYLEKRIENKQSVIFLAVDSQTKTALGFVQLYPSFSSVALKKIWILNDLYVDQPARQRGVAKRLMQKAKEHALETGAARLTLQTGIENNHAQHLYEKIGYKRDDENYYYDLTL